MNILIHYRPTRGSCSSVWSKELIQNEDGSWNVPNIKDDKYGVRYSDSDLERCIKSIIKNSRYKHKIIIATDCDICLNDKWLKQFNYDINVHYSNNKHFKTVHGKVYSTLGDVINLLSNDEIICFALNCDTVVCKNWDVPIFEAQQQYNLDNYVFAPMFVEPRTIVGRSNINSGIYKKENLLKLKEEIEKTGPITVNNIWNEWRKICCHSLTIPPPLERNHFLESDLDNYVNIASQFHKEYIEEPCGARQYGYWAPLISKNINFKNVFKILPSPENIGGCDLFIDANIPVKCKVVLTKSFIFHLHIPCKLDDIEVEREIN